MSKTKKTTEKLEQQIAELERELILLKLRTGDVAEQDRTLFENTGTATIIVETDTTIVLANAKFCELLELSREEIEGVVKWPEYVHEDDRSRMLSYHARRRQAGEDVPKNYSFRLVSAKGNVRDIYLTIDLIPGTGRSIASLSDITELNLLQHALVESEERYRSLSESAHDLIVSINFRGAVKYANRAALQWFEVTEDEAQDRPIFDFIHPDDHSPIADLLNNGEINEGESLRREVRLVNGDAVLHGEMNITIVQTPNGKREILAVIRDVTKRRKAEEALRTSEERLRKVLEGMPVMLVARNDDDLICAWNNECERVTGWKAEETLGNPKVDELIYPDSEYRKQVQDTLHQSGKSYRNEELHIRCKDGSTRFISWSDISSEVPVPGWAYWGMGIDVTELRAAEDKIRDAEKLSVAQELAATVAHEFRQPLAVLQLATDLAKVDGEGSTDPERLSSVIIKAVRRIDTLVNRLLTITQVETRPYALSMSMLDLEKSSGKREKQGE